MTMSTIKLFRRALIWCIQVVCRYTPKTSAIQV